MATMGPFDFSGGYSPGYDFTNLPQKNYATVMKHCRVKAGMVVPRWGWLTVTSGYSDGLNKGLTVWQDTVNSKSSLVVTTSTGKLYQGDFTGYVSVSDSITTMTDRTGAIVTTVLTGNTIFDSLNNILVGTGNSVGAGSVPFKVTAYNANGAALGGTPPAADICKQVNNFMFLARNLSSTTTQSKVYWSNVNDPETWTAANVLEFNKNDGEPIMALGSIGTDLYIFKKTSIGRLSTVTITVSGAVTLGPLVTVIRGVGCAGPRALDNLPNGNIVFVGFDGRFYEFDGSSLVDWGNQSFPEPNSYDSGQYFRDSVNSMGIKEAVATLNTMVKTNNGAREVWIIYDQCFATGSPIQIGFAFNFETHKWQGYIGFDTESSFTLIYALTSFNVLYAAGGTAYPIESSSSMLMGGTASSSTAIFFSGYGKRWYPTSGPSATALVFQIGTTVNLGGEACTFLPRSLILEVHTPSSNPSNLPVLSNFDVYADYDVYEATTSVYTSTSAFQPARLVIPLPFKQDSVGTNVMPTNLSIKITGKGTNTTYAGGGNLDIVRIGRFWLSDEIAR